MGARSWSVVCEDRVTCHNIPIPISFAFPCRKMEIRARTGNGRGVLGVKRTLWTADMGHCLYRWSVEATQEAQSMQRCSPLSQYRPASRARRPRLDTCSPTASYARMRAISQSESEPFLDRAAPVPPGAVVAAASMRSHPHHLAAAAHAAAGIRAR